jgi:hypothetical protein
MDCSTLIRSNGVFLSTIFVGAFASNLYAMWNLLLPDRTRTDPPTASSTSAPLLSGTPLTAAYVWPFAHYPGE